ncbi:MAG: SGNH/GDSL hydrolase family protein [Candidatus Binataceae bacterium]
MRVRNFVERVTYWIGVIWAQFGLLILFLVMVDAVAGMAVRNIYRFRTRTEPLPAEAYHPASWVAEYFKALNRAGLRWYPYVYWKSIPETSPYLNVDPQGNRVTWNKPQHGGGNGRPPLTVFTFGGSTMWGYGVRDDHTLASLISKYLAGKTDYDAEVFNYGQLGYVSTQEVLLLYELLSHGRRPNVVIFYDGINDTFAAYQEGIAGLTQNEFLRVREFNLTNRSRRKTLYLTALRTLLFNTNVARLSRLIAGKNPDVEISDTGDARKILSYLAPGPEAADALQREVVKRYLFNKQIVEMLGKQFGFRCLFYWQPAIFFKNKLALHERSFLGDPAAQRFFLATYHQMAAGAPGNGVRDLSGIFADKGEVYFTDTWHPTESGNEMIAQTIAADVAKRFAELQPNPATGPARIAIPAIPR